MEGGWKTPPSATPAKKPGANRVKCGLWLYVGAGQTQVMFGVSNLEQ